jgi:hypothetical protein
MLAFTIVTLAATGYCIARGIADLRAKKYVWAALGIVVAGALLMTPIQTHAVKMDLPLR